MRFSGQGTRGLRHRGPPRRHPRGGFRFFGPFPGYSGTTRRGTRVHVGGCCLPIPLSVLAAGLTAVAARRGFTAR